MDRFERAVHKWDVASFLRRHGFELRFTASQQVAIRCPHPRCRDRRHRLFISLRTKLSLCFNCNWRGNAIALVGLITGEDHLAAAKLIMGSAGRDLYEADLRTRRVERKIALPPSFHPLRQPPTERSQPFWDYLTGRGLAPSLVLRYGMGYCRVGRYKGRVIIPIIMEGTLCSWVARTIGNAPKKYLTPDYSRMSRFLFNLDTVMGAEQAVLVEGVFDALRLPEVAIATMGNKISRAQIDALTRADFRRLTFCYDAEALKEAIKYAGRIPEYVDVVVAKLPPDTDPGNAPLLALTRALREARPISYADHEAAALGF